MGTENIHNNVHSLRVKKGVTQQKLGDRVGVTRQTVIAIEKGNYVPSVSLALKLAKFFNMSVEKLFYAK
ncbi:MAG: transcriptional regulator [Parcubacteria group bacterium CG10_big_fil_rev_8_21_14_0_10_41_35]|nr:MAG: transcriptional regulator [Parcubacteria group bacterium CG10_big_fil_rev_8_21_14_0_10_41_35]